MLRRSSILGWLGPADGGYRYSCFFSWLADDIVLSEPVSTPQFPVMQGKYREFRRLGACKAAKVVRIPCENSALDKNSLLYGTGNLFEVTGKNFSGTGKAGE